MLNKLRLLTPGPTPLPEEVRLALSRDMIHHRKKDFKKLMASLQEQLGDLFGDLVAGGVLQAAVEVPLRLQVKGKIWRSVAKNSGIPWFDSRLPACALWQGCRSWQGGRNY